MAGIYIHIPFCKRRCIYCDFFSTTQSEKKSAYVRALCRELEMRQDYVGGEEIAIDTSTFAKRNVNVNACHQFSTLC